MKKAVLAVFALLLFTIPVVAQEPAYRLSGYAALNQLQPGRFEDSGPFSVGAGFERATAGNFFVGQEFNQQFGSNAVSGLTTSARYFFQRGGRVEPFAFGFYGAQVNEDDFAAIGGGVDLYGIPKWPKDLGLRFEARDEFNTESGNQSAGIRFGLVFKF